MTVKAILFDKDGTLFDFDATWSVWAGRALRDLAAGDDRKAARLADALGYDFESVSFHPGSSVIAGTLEEQSEALLAEMPGWSLNDITARLVTLATDVQQVEVLSLAPFFAALRARGLKLGVATNDAEASARSHLESVSALALLDFLAGYDSGYGSKPQAGQLRAFAEAVALPEATIAMVGDSTHDLRAARAAGMIAVGVLTGPATEADLAPHADVVLPSIAELPAWLDA